MTLQSPEAIGNAIHQQRTALKMTQTALSGKVGVSRQWIAAIERGKPRAELGLVLRTLDELDLEVSVRANGRQIGHAHSHRPRSKVATFMSRWLPSDD